MDYSLFLHLLYMTLMNPLKYVREESLRIMSKITAGTPKIISKFFNSLPFLERLVYVIQNGTEDVKIFPSNKIE